MNRRAHASLFGSPILIGAVTVLVTVVAVFLSYNANSGLPFVPTYDIRVLVPDAANILRGNDVRIGGKRVGHVAAIRPVEGEGGQPIAELTLKLEKRVEPLRDDTRVLVRPRSTLGLKYLELTPGKRGKPVPFGGRLGIERSAPVVELEDVFNAFDEGTRRGFQGTLDGAGIAFAGRGADLNAAIAEGPALIRRFERVTRALRARRTGLRGFLRGSDAFTGELAARADALGPLVEYSATTAEAFARSADGIDQTLERLPATQDDATRTLAAARPVLRDTARLARAIRPGTAVLDTAGAELHRALDTGIPVLRRTTALAGRLEETLAALEDLAADKRTRKALDRLNQTADSAKPTLDYLAPAQLRCNYLGLWTRNVPSTISEGDANGTWFRTLVVLGVPEMLPAPAPAGNLHANPYPHTGQNGECEAGNELWEPGQRIGNPEGNQGAFTEPTGPPPGVGAR